MPEDHTPAIKTIGDHLRFWRQRRRWSQLELACEARISSRHLSFVETGRSAPSRDMVLHLAEKLEVPPRARNALLIAAGFAPIFRERPLADPALDRAKAAIDLILESQKPFPGFALDRYWQVVSSNDALPEIYEGVAPHLLIAPINVMRLSLHPDGLSSRIVNYTEWRDHLLMRLRHQVEMTADPLVIALQEEVSAYPRPPSDKAVRAAADPSAVAVPLQIQCSLGVLSFVSATTVFGTSVDITLSELILELLFPADGMTADAVRRRSPAASQ